jgi:hypothetical protein
MSWLDTLRDRGMQAKRSAEPLPVMRRQAPPSERPAEIKHVFVQTRRPAGSDPGAVVIGYYSVQGNSVLMHDAAASQPGSVSLSQMVRIQSKPPGD